MSSAIVCVTSRFSKLFRHYCCLGPVTEVTHHRMTLLNTEKCCPFKVLAIYGTALSTINFIFLLVLTIGVALFLWRHYRQEGKSVDSERIHQMGNSNGFAISVQEQASAPRFERSIPLLVNSREVPEEAPTATPPAHIEEPKFQEIPLLIQSKKEAKTPEQQGSDEGVATTVGAMSGKKRARGSLSLPRAPLRKPAFGPKPNKGNPTGLHKNMMMIKSELGSTRKFQGVSGESDELIHADAAEGKQQQQPRRGTTVPKLGRGRGNDYQMAVLIQESSKDAASQQDNSPYYHKVMGTCEPEEYDAEGEEQDGCSGLRGTRSMSDTAAYGFPLKKNESARPKTRAKPSHQVADYEPVRQNPILERQHSKVVAAEEQGEYSKLNRKEMVKENTAREPQEGYDHISAPERENIAPVLYGLDELIPKKDTN